MSAPSADDASPPKADIPLSAEQEKVRQALWACTNASPRIGLIIGSSGLHVAASFDKAAPGIVFQAVESGPNQIRVAGKLDPATVEVNYESLRQAARLHSREEAEQVWESIKELIRSAQAARASEGQSEYSDFSILTAWF